MASYPSTKIVASQTCLKLQYIFGSQSCEAVGTACLQKAISVFLPLTVNHFIAGLKIGNLNTYFRFTVLHAVVFHTPIFIPVSKFICNKRED